LWPTGNTSSTRRGGLDVRLAELHGTTATVWSTGPAALRALAGVAPSRLVAVCGEGPAGGDRADGDRAGGPGGDRAGGGVAGVLARLLPVVGLPGAPDRVAELTGGELTHAPRVVAVTSLGTGETLDLLRRGPELIVVDGTDPVLRDAIRGITDRNGFPPVPAAAGDSRFRIEDGRVFCSDEPLFPFDGDPATDGHALCVALAVLDGIGADVPGRRAELRAAL
jgi:hypothetical protein